MYTRPSYPNSGIPQYSPGPSHIGNQPPPPHAGSRPAHGGPSHPSAGSGSAYHPYMAFARTASVPGQQHETVMHQQAPYQAGLEQHVQWPPGHQQDWPPQQPHWQGHPEMLQPMQQHIPPPQPQHMHPPRPPYAGTHDRAVRQFQQPHRPHASHQQYQGHHPSHSVHLPYPGPHNAHAHAPPQPPYQMHAPPHPPYQMHAAPHPAHQVHGAPYPPHQMHRAPHPQQFQPHRPPHTQQRPPMGAGPPQQSVRPAGKRRFEFFCEPCTKGFECEEDYDIHLAEDHVVCSHPGCLFSAKEDVVRAHRAKHEVADSPEEIEAWIAMRKFKFPRKNEPLPTDQPPPVVSKLETFIRSSLRQAAIEARKRRKERDAKAPCIHWERTGRCQFGDRCNFAHEKVGVCTFFVNHGRCRHGDACKYKHVRRNSKELEENRNPHGHLLRKLLGPEIDKFETQMLQVVRHMVRNGFYQGEQVEEQADEGELEGDLEALADLSEDEEFSEAE